MVDTKDLHKVLEPEPPYVPGDSSLLRKYGIPVQNLDFDYVQKCTNARELEKIYHILQSGQEGHFPELMKRTEEKLFQLKPNSRYIRKDTPLLTKDRLNKDELTNLNTDLEQWLTEVNNSNKELSSQKSSCKLRDTPPIRSKKECQVDNNKKSNTQRIKSTDYAAWDKYDVDTELLKMDIEEEKMRAEVKNKEKTKVKEKKVRINEFSTKTELEYEAQRDHLKGDECYKAGDFEEALSYYTASISLLPSKKTYTSRAWAYIKLKKYNKALSDFGSALEIDSRYIDALYGISEAYISLKQYEPALKNLYKIIAIDPNNAEAQKKISQVHDTSAIPIQKLRRMAITDVEKVNKNNKSDNRQRSILKHHRNNKVILPIPGPSHMPEPYFLTVPNDPLALEEAQSQIASWRKRLICFPSIDRDPEEDSELFDNRNEEKKKKIYPVRSRMYRKHSRKVENEEKIHEIKVHNKKMNGKISQTAQKQTALFQSKCNESEDKKENACSSTSKQNQISNNRRLLNNINCERTDNGGGGEPFIQSQPVDVPIDELHMPFTFFRSWNAIPRDGTYTKHAEVLRQLDMNRLTQVIGNKLDSTMLATILQCLYQHFTVASEIEKVYTALLNLPNLPRFDIMLMFLSKSEKICIQNLLEFLAQHDRNLPSHINKIYSSL